MEAGNTLPNAAIGGAVAIVSSAVLGPASPVLGGGVAGYLQGGTSGDGATVGALSGLIALLPIVVFLAVFAVLGFVPLFGLFASMHDLFGGFPMETTAGAPEGFAVFGGGMFLLWLLVFLLAFVFAAVFTVGLGALGGVGGAYVAAETDRGN
jgi:hypothetical protein